MDDRLVELLELYGLSERESLIFLHLTRNGPSGAGDVAKALDLRRMEAYRLLKKLLDRGLVASTLGKPVKYHAESLDNVMSLLMNEQGQYMRKMEEARPELKEMWKQVASTSEKFEENRFRIIQGREQIYAAISKMVISAQKSVDALMTKNDLVQADLTGLSGELSEAQERGARVRISTRIDASILDPVQRLGKNVAVWHSDEAARTRLVLVDGTQTLVSLVLDDTQGMKNEKDVAIWTDSKDYAETMGALYETSFERSEPAEGRIMVLAAERQFGNRMEALLNVFREAVASSGWSLLAPGNLKGASGTMLELTAVLTRPGEPPIGIDVIAGDRKSPVRERLAAASMKKVDMGESRMVIVSVPAPDEESRRLAEFLGIKLIDGSDAVDAATELRSYLGLSAS